MYLSDLLLSMTNNLEQDLTRVIIVEEDQVATSATQRLLESYRVSTDQIRVMTPKTFADMPDFPPLLRLVLTDGLKGGWETVVTKVRSAFEGKSDEAQVLLLTTDPDRYRQRASEVSVQLLDKFAIRQLSQVFATLARQLAESDEGTSQR